MTDPNQMINVSVIDVTGSRDQPVAIPANAPVRKVIAKLVTLLELPVTGPDGAPVSYRFHHKRSGGSSWTATPSPRPRSWMETSCAFSLRSSLDSCMLDLVLADHRYDRQERITWWDQERLATATVVVVGVGACSATRSSRTSPWSALAPSR